MKVKYDDFNLIWTPY